MTHEADMHTVIGLSDNHVPVELERFEYQSEARRWIRQYTRWGDWGGYDAIALSDPDDTWLEVFEPSERSTA